MELIANSSGLLYLIGMILLMATLLGAFVVFSIARRRKKPKMKHGSQRSKSEAEETTDSDQPPAEALEVKPTVSPSHIPAAPPSSNQITTSIENKLDLGLLGKSIEPETAMDDTPKPIDQKPVDLAARLTASPVEPTPTPKPTTEPEELLRLLRDPQSGQLIIEIAGQRYTKLASVTDKKVGQFILNLTAHLLAFSNGVIITAAGMKSIYNPKQLKEVPMPLGPSSTSVPRAPVPPPKPEPASVPPPPVPKPSPKTELPPLDSLRTPQAQPPSPPPQPSGLLGRIVQPAPPPPSLPGLNLAEEINDIVQDRLKYSPLGTNNQIEITSDHHGGIRIEVNRQFYSSPNEVPDPDVKELIKASIKEWESK